MEQRERVLRRIDQVLELEAAPEVAYPLRARLARAMIEAARFFNSVDPRSDEAMTLTQRASRIMQPSEPFDGVWQGEWNAATDDLRAIRARIVKGDTVGR